MNLWLTKLSLELWQKFALAALIGMMLGLEREHSHLEEDGTLFAGIRTFPLIDLLGYKTALLTTNDFMGLFAIGYVGLLILIMVVYIFFSLSG